MDNLVELAGETGLPIPAERVLARATTALAAEDWKAAIVIGAREDGTIYFESSDPDGPRTLWLLERIKMVMFYVSDAWPE